MSWSSVTKTLYAVAIFLVILIISQVFIKAILNSFVSSDYLVNLLTLLTSIGFSFVVTRKFLLKQKRKYSL